MSTFTDLYGTDLDTELGTVDRDQRFTTVLRKRYVNEGQRKFNEQTKCFVKRGSISIVDGTQEYDLEAALTDFLEVSGTTASLKRVGTTTAYTEGPELKIKSEEWLNQRFPNWRSDAAATPEYVYRRNDGGASNIGLHPAPDVPAGETWTLLLPYVAQPADMTDDSHEPYGNASPLITLRPYHKGILHYATAQCELLRKDREKWKEQMALFSGVVAQYFKDKNPVNGIEIRMATPYRRRGFGVRPLDPTRYP